MNARPRDYSRLKPALNDELLARQLDTRKLAKFSVAVIVTGVPSAGRSETVNKLIEWLDPKYVSVRAFGADASDSEYPPMWRYWRALPAFGRIAFYFWGWYGEYLDCELGDSRKAQRRAQRQLERIRRLEVQRRLGMLGAPGEQQEGDGDAHCRHDARPGRRYFAPEGRVGLFHGAQTRSV